MRWLYPDEHDTEENAARKAVLSRVDRWWQSLAAQADAIAAYLHGAGEFDVPEFMAEQLEAVDPRLGWEFSATGPRRCRLVISVDGHLSLRPMVDAMLARAPALPNWEFLNAHPADTLAGALSAVEAETDHAVGARVRAQVRSMNRVDLQFWLPDAGGHELARTQAVIAACRLLGEDALARWVGAIEAVNETGTGRWLPLDALQQAVFSEVAGVNARLPEVPLVSMVKDLRWSLWRLNPPQQGDYPGEQDLIMGSSALEEMSACAQLGAPFDSRRYSKVGETFCFLKFDGEGRKVAPRMDERKRVESALGAALVEGGLGCVVGAGTGRRYSYLDLALTDVQASLPLIRAHMRGAEVSRRSWLLFHDATLAEEWVGIYDDTPLRRADRALPKPPPTGTVPRRMDLKTVQHVARLARLQLTDAEAARMAADMARITEHIHALGKVDVRGVEPTVHPVAARNQWREDAVTESFTREQATQNAPESEQNFFKVPPVIE